MDTTQTPDSTPKGLELTLEKKDGEVTLNFCGDCGSKMSEAVIYFQGLFKEVEEGKEVQEREAKKIKTLEKNIQYLLGQVEGVVQLEDMQNFRDAIVTKHEELDKEIAALKTFLVKSKGPIEQWRDLTSQIEATNSKKRRK